MILWHSFSKESIQMLTTTHLAAADYRRDLGDGLILRWSTAEDTEKIAQLVGQVFRNKEDEPHNEFLANVVRVMLAGQIPSVMGENDYAIIEDTSKEVRPVVAAVCLQRQQWKYEGMLLTLGRPEIVATHPDYRNKGLIRAIFELVHARSEVEGHMVQGITGIPNFYRQFGYEYALDLDELRLVYLHAIPQLKEGEEEPYTMREATLEELPVVRELYNRYCDQYMISTHSSDEIWHYMLKGWQDDPQRFSINTIQVILDSKQTIVGTLLTQAERRRKTVYVIMLATAPGVNLQRMTPSLLRALQTYGEKLPVSKSNTAPFTQLGFSIGVNHPLYDVLGKELAPYGDPPYAWYIRVPDLLRFIQFIAPVLERRLADSPVAGFTGDFKLNLYRSGLKLVFENGQLKGVEPWRAPIYGDGGEVEIPRDVFLKALFGYRSLDELRYAYPDVITSNEVMFNALFPKKPSWTVILPF
jgi:GNAT superfamily N-acetyltransferase